MSSSSTASEDTLVFTLFCKSLHIRHRWIDKILHSGMLTVVFLQRGRLRCHVACKQPQVRNCPDGSTPTT